MKHFDKHGPLHFNKKNPSLTPLVFKIGDKVDDDRFRALALNLASKDPEQNASTITNEGRFVVFDKRGGLSVFSSKDWFNHYINLFGANINPNAFSVATTRFGVEAGYLVIFSRTQLAEFLVLTDGEEETVDGQTIVSFPQRVPLSIVSTHNPHSGKTEDTLYLHELPPMSTAAKVIDKHFLGGIRGLYPEFSQLEADACFQSLIEGILSIIIEQETITAKERKEIITKLIVDRKVLRGVIPDAVKTIHSLAQIHDAAGSSRRVILREVYETTPAHLAAITNTTETK